MVNITYSTPISHDWRSAKYVDLALGLVATSPDILARFWRFVQKSDGCWLWTGNVAGRAGHGQFAIRHNVNRYAHRISWVLHFGSITPGLKVCHRCDVARCVNPAHLFLGTQADNLTDMRAKGRHRLGGKRRLQASPSHPEQPQGHTHRAHLSFHAGQSTNGLSGSQR